MGMGLPVAGTRARSAMPSNAKPALTEHPSPNFGPRRDGAQPDLVVLHYTAMPTAKAALDRLCDPEYEVSAHYLIDEAGQVFCLVSEDMRAWHAGAGAWGDVSDVNSRSIGIELANPGDAPFAAAQMDALEALLSGVLDRWLIPPERVIAHSDLAPERKCDPGARFDWKRLSRQGLAVWGDADDEAGEFDASLTRFGYPPAAPKARLAAFRLRFFPGATGELSNRERAFAQNLARRFPVDRSAPST